MGVNLRGADLGGADLGGADLGGANLVGAAGIIRLSFSHGWDLAIIRYVDVPRVHCGCRWFASPDEARKHWHGHADKQRHTVVLPALERLLAQAKDEGWPGCDPPKEP